MKEKNSESLDFYQIVGCKSHVFGNVAGKATYQRLIEIVEKSPTCEVFAISLKEIEATDASFPRESVISVAKKYRTSKAFLICDLTDRDVIDNWNYAALAKEQPIILWSCNKYEILGDRLTESMKKIFNFIYLNKKNTTSEVAVALNLSVQNASTQLKKMYEQGYVMRQEEVAESGGKEFFYKAIAPD